MKSKKDRCKSFWSEFKTFIARGNVLDMAVGIVIGGAFTAIVNALVTNILNPIIGLATDGIDFGKLKLVLKVATEDKADLAVTYGVFINAVVNFIIVSLVVFCLVKSFNKLKSKAERRKLEEAQKIAKDEVKSATEAKPAENEEIALLKEIRDLLSEKQ